LGWISVTRAGKRNEIKKKCSEIWVDRKYLRFPVIVIERSLNALMLRDIGQLEAF